MRDRGSAVIGAMTDLRTGRWVRTYAVDVAAGDLVRIDGMQHRVISRNRPPFTEPTFKVRFPGGVRTLGKLSRLEIWDEDGTVTARVQAILEWRSQ